MKNYQMRVWFQAESDEKADAIEKRLRTVVSKGSVKNARVFRENAPHHYIGQVVPGGKTED